MAEETIGDWTVEKLVRFIQQSLEEFPPSRFPTISCDTFTSNIQTTFNDQVQFMQFQTTVGAAGAASALPATPTGYFRVLDYTGQPHVIPYYKAN